MRDNGSENNAAALSGSCGEKTVWRFEPDTGTLTIDGQGATENWTEQESPPWAAFRESVAALEVKEGVTALGDYACGGCTRLTRAELAGSVDLVGTYAFRGCVALEEISLPEGVRIIGSKAFESCTALRTVRLPESLRYVDMRAFFRADAIADVCYAGTREQWERIAISRQAQANESLLRANLHCARVCEDVRQRYADITDETPYREALQYLCDQGWLEDKSGRFDGDRPACREELLGILWRRAGSPGRYDSPSDWAKSLGLLTDGEETFCRESLARLFFRLAARNRQTGLPAPGAEDGDGAEALSWCAARGFLPEKPSSGGGADMRRPLSRGEVCAAAAAWLRSPESLADRYEAIAAQVREAVSRGGDGRMYVLTPKKVTDEMKEKSRSGDCTLILFPHGSTMMIDSGAPHAAGAILRLLEKTGVRRLDTYVLSHTHGDHVGGSREVAEYLYRQSGEGCIGRYYSSRYSSAREDDFRAYLRDTVKTEMHTDVVSERNAPYPFPEIDGVSIRLFNPSEEMIRRCEDGAGDAESINSVSIVMRFVFGESVYLTGGDVYCTRERELAAEYGEELRADIMKTNHHGTHASSSGEWLAAVKPLAVISDADDNGCQPLAEKLSENGTAFYTEGLDGLIAAVLDGTKQYRIYTQYDSSLRSRYRGRKEITERG